MFAAVYTENKAVVRFLLRQRADPSGYQSQRFSEETGYQTQISPLHQCVQLGRPDFVDTLLRARADPDEYGYETTVAPWFPERDHSTNLMRPLWNAVDHASAYPPISQPGLAHRAIIQLLLCYGAHAEVIGKKEHHILSDEDSTSSIDSYYSKESTSGRRTSRNTETPLGLALTHNAREWQCQLQSHNPPWTTDIIYMLLALEHRYHPCGFR